MADRARDIGEAQRTALLRHGVVVIASQLEGPHPWIVVTGAGDDRVQKLVTQQVGAEVEVEVLGDLPRELRPLRCVGYMEREAGRLQLRFVLRGDEHVDDIVVAEDDADVVVLATVCTAVAGETGRAWEGPWHVYLDRPLAGRSVVDGSSGASVPYVNVYDRLRGDGTDMQAAPGGLNAAQSSSSERWRPSARRRSGSTRTRPS